MCCLRGTAEVRSDVYHLHLWDQSLFLRCWTWRVCGAAQFVCVCRDGPAGPGSVPPVRAPRCTTILIATLTCVESCGHLCNRIPFKSGVRLKQQDVHGNTGVVLTLEVLRNVPRLRSYISHGLMLGLEHRASPAMNCLQQTVCYAADCIKVRHH